MKIETLSIDLPLLLYRRKMWWRFEWKSYLQNATKWSGFLFHFVSHFYFICDKRWKEWMMTSWFIIIHFETIAINRS